MLIALSAPRRPRFAQLAFLTVSAFLHHEQGVEPAILAVADSAGGARVPRWRLLLVWMLIDAFLWLPRMYFYLGKRKADGR